jgi:hypothetical protein
MKDLPLSWIGGINVMKWLCTKNNLQIQCITHQNPIIFFRESEKSHKIHAAGQKILSG